MIAALALATLGACGSDEPEQPQAQGVCVVDDVRVDDDYCDDDDSDGRSGGGFFFFAAGSRYPGVGERVSSYPGGTTAVPMGQTAVRGGAEVRGGTVARGGFGSSSKGSGTGG
jgi:hypothetical protein